jgi:hypothetical protein
MRPEPARMLIFSETGEVFPSKEAPNSRTYKIIETIPRTDLPQATLYDPKVGFAVTKRCGSNKFYASHILQVNGHVRIDITQVDILKGL